MGNAPEGRDTIAAPGEAITCRHGLTRSAWGEQHATEEEWCRCAASVSAPHVYKANIKIDLKLNLGSFIAFVVIAAAIVWLVARAR